MANDELDKVELPAIEQLKSLGWIYVKGEELSPDNSTERTSFKEVVLEKRLSNNIKRINPWISDQNLQKVVNNITKTHYTNLIEANESIWKSINECVSVMQDLGKGNKGQTVHIIDFENPENNEFLCTNQLKVAGINQNIIPDIILFVNGLPLGVIECKSPYITNPMEAGINQLLRYANRRTPENYEGAEKLFHYNHFMISTHRDKARVGSITSQMEHYLEWKDPYPITADKNTEEGSQEILIAGLLNKNNFLDTYQNFTVFEPENGKIIKKIARYQQFRAVHKTIERLKSGTSAKEKSGVIWHTQGSGKSLTMVFLSLKMRRDPDLRDYKLVFLTDRTQLDNQLTNTFMNTQDETIFHAKSVKELKERLSRDSSEIVTAMMQKFQENADDFEFPVLNESEKIIILADEAHRSQYGTLGAAINSALPNAPKIAFTGTPLIKTQKTTNTFGSYIDTYTIEQAVKDGATVQILYEGREPSVKVTADSLDSLFDEYFEDRTDDEKALIKKKFGTTQAILEAPQRIRRVCLDIIKHYRNHIKPNNFKAMIVTSSRNAAIIYKEQLDKLEAPQSAVIISGEHNDEKRYWDHTDSAKHKKQIEDFKKPFGVGEGHSDLSILIVKDMLLTGFDAPIAQVMYVDRKLTDHTLLQAIARVNRTNKNKFRGYIVDYYGLSDYLTEALEMFTTEDIQGALLELKEELPKLKNAHTRVLKHFEKLDIDDLDACILSLEDEVKRQSFLTDFRVFSRQLDIILPDPEAKPFLRDLNRLGKIAHGAKNRFRDEQLDYAGAGEKVRELIEEHIISTGVNPKIPPVDLLDKNYKEHLNEHKSPRSRASEIENAIKHHITINIDEDPEYYKALSERLKTIIEEQKEKWENLVQILLNLRENIETDHKSKAKDLGLSMIELSFYNILVSELGGEDEINETKSQQAKDVVKSLVATLDEVTKIVDFFNKWDEQKRIKRDIKRIVIDKFDESLVKPVSERFMELAKVKFG
jgi:type I restriction enzyme R subunit